MTGRRRIPGANGDPGDGIDGGSTRRTDRGSASVELAVIAPAVLTLLAAAVIGGRVNEARQSIESAAFDAARTASLARDYPTARSEATTAARATMEGQGLHCTDLTVSLTPAAAFSTPVGQPATITATLACRADFTDIALPGMPGDAELRASFTSPLDTYRGRAATSEQGRGDGVGQPVATTGEDCGVGPPARCHCGSGSWCGSSSPETRADGGADG